jgi:hypothetical protein
MVKKNLKSRHQSSFESRNAIRKMGEMKAIVMCKNVVNGQ